MKKQPQIREVKLCLKADPAILPTVQNFIEKTALAFGLGQSEALALTLAGEEIFNYLCSNIELTDEIQINCHEGSHYTALDFILPLKNLAMQAFNLTASINIEDEESLDEMGLLIASRMVDHMEISHDESGDLLLTLRKNKSYPKITAPEHPTRIPATENLTTVTPDPEELKFFITESHLYTPAALLPHDFYYPGKIVDMVNAGEFRAAIIRDPAGGIGGGIIWHWYSPKMVECYGPFILADATSAIDFEQRQTLAQTLLEHCLNEIARSPAVGLLNLTPGPDLPQHHFESLGTVFEYHNNAPDTEISALFRLLQEDPGTVTWAHPELEPFLRNEYQRLTLPREIRRTSNTGESQTDFSVLTVNTDSNQARKKVTLQPLWAGADMEKNIADHVALFTREGIDNIYFTIDLGQSWQAAFAPALSKNGFVPLLILPYGGRGDLLILQKTKTPENGLTV